MDLLKLARGEVDEGSELPAPDELLLELMDLCALAFPEPLAKLEVVFVPNEDGKRPALSDLNGIARPGAPKRPDLGHGDDEVLDAINALLAGELDEGRLLLRQYVNATIGFGELARRTGKADKNLIRTLGPSGSPTAANLFQFIQACMKAEGVTVAARVVRKGASASA